MSMSYIIKWKWGMVLQKMKVISLSGKAKSPPALLMTMGY